MSDELLRCVVLRATVGSRAWGLADEHSDEDLRGVFAVPFSLTTGLTAPPEDIVADGGSTTYWEAKKAIRLALRADPGALEMLFVPNVHALDPIGAWILEERDLFATKKIYGASGRYALGQLKRLEKLARSETEKRPKNAYNLARILGTAIDWLRTGEPSFEIVGDRKGRLLAIKHGEVALADVIAEAEAMSAELDRAHETSPLPDRPDMARADALVRRINEEIARRWFVSQSFSAEA